jgi:hypothetical protein
MNLSALREPSERHGARRAAPQAIVIEEEIAVRAIRIVACLAVMGSLMGCGKGPGDAAVKSASGKVTLEGRPLEGARVLFLPDGSTAGFGGMGITDPAGEYQLKGTRGGVGVPPGEYKVVISRLVKPDGTTPPPDAKLAEIDARESLPAYYTNPAITTLKATVTEKGGKLDFELRTR